MGNGRCAYVIPVCLYSLNKNDHLGPINLNAWSPVGTTWERLGGVAFLEKVCHGGWALRFPKPTPRPVFNYLCLLPVDPDAKLSVTAPVPSPSAPCHDGHGLTLENWKQAPDGNFIGVALAMVFLHSNKTVTKTEFEVNKMLN